MLYVTETQHKILRLIRKKTCLFDTIDSFFYILTISGGRRKKLDSKTKVKLVLDL